MLNGAVIYRGASSIDGAPIIAVVTGLRQTSKNPKLGDRLLQTWILREDVSPTAAVVKGDDISICGTCSLRGMAMEGRVINRKCYVPVYFAPLSIWKCYKDQPAVPLEHLRGIFCGRGVRLGAYGDPAVVPTVIWQEVTAEAAFWTGYTHQWRNCDTAYSKWCMASCENIADRNLARELGYRTFRITDRDARQDRRPMEIVCPASAEMGHRTTCGQCRSCGGINGSSKTDIVITIHGMVASRDRRKNVSIV
jgi:hypothetical protein